MTDRPEIGVQEENYRQRMIALAYNCPTSMRLSMSDVLMFDI